MYTRFRNISYVMAYAVATIPLWYYVTDDRIMLLMTLVVGFAYVNVVLSSVDAAQGILTSEKAKSPMPRWLPDKPKYQKWWAIKRRTLRWHLLLIPAKMGLALGFAEFLFGSRYGSTLSILKPYFYGSPSAFFVYPQWETLLLGISIIVLFSLLENGLMASLVLLTLHSSRLIVLRLLIALSVIGVMSQYQPYISTFPLNTTPQRLCNDPCLCRGNGCWSNTYQQKRTNIRIGETIQTGIFTLNDMGVLLAANIMRPEGFGYYWVGIDNRLLVAALLGVLVYLATIFTVLRFVRDSDFAAET
jgi:hypothetical protein